MARFSTHVRYVSRPRKKGRAAQLFGLFFVCAVLLVFSRLEYGPVREAGDRLSDAAAPMLDALSLPAAHVKRVGGRVASLLAVYDERDRLKEENERLRHWEWRAQRLERQLARLRGLVNAVEEPALRFATARVIADARAPFARSVLVNLGRADGVKAGYAVIDSRGLVGRVVNAGERASRVILLNDFSSRVPVLVGPTAVRAVLVGENGSHARLEVIPGTDGFLPGDEVYTSGDDGVLPRGLRIGVLEGGGRGAGRVRTHARLDDLEFVSVLFFEAPTVELDGQTAGLRGWPASGPGAQAARTADGAPERR